MFVLPDSPPVATYRVQLTPSFGFAEAAESVPYLAQLGISHLYLSPVAEAVAGSTHGYDVVDPSSVRDELGGREALRHLAERARAHRLGLLLDLVPNHVSTAEPPRNPWWWAMLRDGPAAREAAYFDVDWESADGRVIVPTLGTSLAECLASGELRVDGDVVHYHATSFPLRPDAPTVGGADTGDPTGVAALLEHQHYRLQHWRDPDRNVRRFFTIDDLVAIRPELPDVADAVHHIAAELAADDLIDGVRIDHVDGLAHPARYLRDLRRVVGPERWLVVEKILVGDEVLSPAWPVQGTTGYEWIRLVDHLFTHPSGEEPCTRLWRDTTGDQLDYHDHELAGVRAVLHGALHPDLRRVARTAAAELGVPDAERLVGPLEELTIELGRYRTYLERPDDADRPAPAAGVGEVELLRAVGERAASALTDDDASLVRGLVDVIAEGGPTAVRWQQLTGPALAKGGEDRALYRWFRLAAHNEVGGDPDVWSTSVEAFHEHAERVARAWPLTLLAGSTHDAKRSEDTRARLLALSELGERWPSTVEAWRSMLDDDEPGGAALLLAVQTVVAAWPIDATRLGDHLVKAAREAGEHTSWTDPDPEHEAALHRLARRLTSPPLSHAVAVLVDEVEPAAHAIALAQLVLRCTAPGVPDVYQGATSWLHRLVDPDNRQPLDVHELRRDAVAAAEAAPPPADATAPEWDREWIRTCGSVWSSPRPKAAVLARTLAVRRRWLPAFGEGSRYVPLRATGRYADHVIAFTRLPRPEDGDDTVVCVSARFPRSRPEGWLGTTLTLPDGTWFDALDATGAELSGTIELSGVLAEHPAALLVPTERASGERGSITPI